MIADAVGGVCRLVTGATVEWECPRDDAAPRVYFANHASHLDFVLIWSALPPSSRRRARPVAGRDYWDAGAIRRLVAGRIFHAVLVDRGTARPGGALRSLAAMTDALDRGDSLIVFPEGTRSRDGRIGAFKSGLYHLARRRPEVDLIPVLLQNTDRILPRGEVVPVPLLSHLVFGPAMRAGCGEDKHAFLGRARAALAGAGDHHDRTH